MYLPIYFVRAALGEREKQQTSNKLPEQLNFDTDTLLTSQAAGLLSLSQSVQDERTVKVALAPVGCVLQKRASEVANRILSILWNTFLGNEGV